MYSLDALTWDDFRPQARRLILAGIAPAQVIWRQQDGLFDGTVITEVEGSFSVPKGYVAIGKTVACHNDPERWSLLYEALWRIRQGEVQLLQDPADAVTRKLNMMAQQVGRDIHKTHAFVRFRKTEIEGQDTYLAWHCPDHRIMTLAAPFFVSRFRNQRWGIATPQESCSWDGEHLVWGEGLPASVAPAPDDVEGLWRTYYRHIFNPARIKIKMMKSEMPVRHWRTLPETQDIAEMLREAPERVERMMASAVYSSPRSQQRAEKVRNQLNRPAASKEKA